MYDVKIIFLLMIFLEMFEYVRGVYRLVLRIREFYFYVQRKSIFVIM